MAESARSSFDRDIQERLDAQLAAVNTEGFSAARIERIFGDAINRAVKLHAPVLVEKLRNASPKLVSEIRSADEGVRADLRGRWGPDLDRLAVIRNLCEERAGDFYDDNRVAADKQPALLTALAQLSALSIRISGEIYHLLLHGYPDAAMARTRALHELFVTATVIADYQGKPCSEDLADRYLSHPRIARYAAAKTEFESASVPEHQKLSATALAVAKKSADDLVRKYGGTFKLDWGWAMPLFPKSDDCKFSNLEKLADVSLFRAHYASASNYVHGGSFGTAANLETDATNPAYIYMMTGPRVTDLSTPMQLTSIYLVGITSALVLSGAPGQNSPGDRLIIRALEILLAEAVAALTSI